MKKLLTAILSLSLLGAAALPALAADPEPPMDISSPELIAPAPEEDLTAPGYAIEVDGEQVNIRACVMVPLRAVAEKLGFTVAWDNGVVTVTGAERYVQLTIGENQYFAAPTEEGMMGASLFSLSCAPHLLSGSTYVPVELFDALLGCEEGTVTLEGNTVKINTDPSAADAVQIPNPFTDHAALEDAAKAVEFDLAIPEEVNSSPRRNIQTMDGKMIQVFYGDEDQEVCIRTAPGSEDISGNFNSYTQVKTMDVNGSAVTMKGENGLVHLAIWTSDGYTYSISARAGMSAADMTALVQAVK